MNLKITIVSVIIAFALLLPGCATIISKSEYPISFNSSPVGADINITNKKGTLVYTGTTPCTVSLKAGNGYFSKAEYTVNVKLDGYYEKQAVIRANINGWYFGNILLGGLIGMLIVDPATGAMWKLNHEAMDFILEANGDQASEKVLQIIHIKDIPESVKKDLVQIN